MRDFGLAERGIRVAIGECCLDTETDIALEDARAQLNDEERARAASFVFARDRDRYVRAHGYLRQRLGAFLGVAPREVPIMVGDDGKPVLEDRRAHFNLSHSGSRAVVAVAEEGEVGIDLEVLDGRDGLADQLDDLARSVLTPDERRALADIPQARRVRRFLSYWTAKEARMKLTGEGMRLEPRAIALHLLGGRPIGYRRPRTPPARLRFIPLSSPDLICCLAVQGDGLRS